MRGGRYQGKGMADCGKGCFFATIREQFLCFKDARANTYGICFLLQPYGCVRMYAAFSGNPFRNRKRRLPANITKANKMEPGLMLEYRLCQCFQNSSMRNSISFDIIYGSEMLIT